MKEHLATLNDADHREVQRHRECRGHTVGYNVQSAVETKHHLIVTHEVTKVSIDNGHLSEMAKQARDALEAEEIEVLADKATSTARRSPLARTPASMSTLRNVRRRTRGPKVGSTRMTPFGTIKAWMRATHFKMKTLQHVATELALHVLAYNLKRVIAILGVPGLVEAITAFLAWLAGTMRPASGSRPRGTPICAS